MSNNQSSSSNYKTDLHELSGAGFQQLQVCLRLLRQVDIMMWAYRFDHAADVLQDVFYVLSKIEEAESDERTPPIGNHSTVEGIKAKANFLQNRLKEITSHRRNQKSEQSFESQSDQKSPTFEGATLEIADRTFSLRAYCFDQKEIPVQRYINVFRKDQLNSVSVLKEDTYPLIFRVFRSDLFADIAVFASDHLEIEVTFSDVSKSAGYIDDIISKLNATRNEE